MDETPEVSEEENGEDQGRPAESANKTYLPIAAVGVEPSNQTVNKVPKKTNSELLDLHPHRVGAELDDQDLLQTASINTAKVDGH